MCILLEWSKCFLSDSCSEQVGAVANDVPQILG